MRRPFAYLECYGEVAFPVRGLRQVDVVESVVEYLVCDTSAVASVAALGCCAPRVETVQ